MDGSDAIRERARQQLVEDRSAGRVPPSHLPSICCDCPSCDYWNRVAYEQVWGHGTAFYDAEDADAGRA